MPAPLRNLGQPWLFVYYTVAFGGLICLIRRDGYLIRRDGVGISLAQGLLFAGIMSFVDERRRSRAANRADD
jgi:hypothetical protein